MSKNTELLKALETAQNVLGEVIAERDALIKQLEVAMGIIDKIPHSYRRVDFGGVHDDTYCLKCEAQKALAEIARMEAQDERPLEDDLRHQLAQMTAERDELQICIEYNSDLYDMMEAKCDALSKRLEVAREALKKLSNWGNYEWTYDDIANDALAEIARMEAQDE